VVVSEPLDSVVVVSSAVSLVGVEPVATVPGVVVALLLLSSSSPHAATATSAITESAASAFLLRDL
jgi:hypothetical protein